jgi:hypothetical protein
MKFKDVKTYPDWVKWNQYGWYVIDANHVIPDEYADDLECIIAIFLRDQQRIIDVQEEMFNDLPWYYVLNEAENEAIINLTLDYLHNKSGDFEPVKPQLRPFYKMIIPWFNYKINQYKLYKMLKEY